MKSKNIFQLLSMTILTICTISCNDDLPTEKREILPSEENVSIESDKEALYDYQTNKDMILYSLIRHNHIENKYFLDASEKDIERLGITDEAYKDGQTRVEQLNEANIDRQ